MLEIAEAQRREVACPKILGLIWPPGTWSGHSLCPENKGQPPGFHWERRLCPCPDSPVTRERGASGVMLWLSSAQPRFEDGEVVGQGLSQKAPSGPGNLSLFHLGGWWQALAVAHRWQGRGPRDPVTDVLPSSNGAGLNTPGFPPHLCFLPLF